MLLMNMTLLLEWHEREKYDYKWVDFVEICAAHNNKEQFFFLRFSSKKCVVFIIRFQEILQIIVYIN